MSRRGYASSEISERDYYPPHSSHHGGRGGGRTAEYEEVDIHERRRNVPAPEPEFLREGYGRRSDAGPLVVRDRERSRERPRRGGREVEEREETVVREKSRERPRRERREVVEEDIVIEKHEKPRRREREREREVIEDEVIVDRGPRRRDDVREEIVYAERDTPPSRPIRTERENFEFYRREQEVEREPPPIREAPMPPPLAPVRSEREIFEYRPKIREPSPSPEREEIIIRERERERPRYREERDEEIIIRRDERSRERPRYREERDEEIIIRDRERERPRREERDEEIIIRERERERPRYREDRDEEIIIRRDEPRRREVERDSLTVRSDERPRARSRGGLEESDALVIRRTEGSGRSRGHSRAPSRGDFQEEISIHERERERPFRARSPSRDREEITFRHDDRGGRHTDEIMIRRNERSPSPEPIREPEPIIRPPVVQEVITHHRHIDHGFERGPEPSRPRSPSPVRSVRDDRIEIRHRGQDASGRRYDDDIIFERERGGRRELEGVHRGHNNRDSDEFAGALIRSSDREVGPPVRYEAREARKDRLWTEITKDLVSEEAIREKGYEWEEAEDTYFVMEHLKYDDVLALTELTEEIRADRRDRISEIQAEREMGPPPRRSMGRGEQQWDEERVVEREIIYEGPPGGGGRRPPQPHRGYR